MKKIALLSLLLTGCFIAADVRAAATSISFDSGSHLLYTTSAQTTPLSQGVTATLGDGALLQLGYYSLGTTTSPFLGTFITLAGINSTNTFPTYGNKLTIGDDPSNGAGAGQYALTLVFTAGSATTGNNLPAAGQQLAIRFFNGTTAANSTLYNAVNAPGWTFPAPATPTASNIIELDDIGLRFLDGSTNHFYTSLSATGVLTVPEPSTWAMMGLGAAGLGLTLRRRHIARA